MTALFRSLRILRKNWKLTVIATLSLSVAMAVAVICLGISNTAVLAPPAGESPRRLVMVYERAAGSVDHISYPDFEYYRDNNHVFDGTAALAEEISAGRMSFGAPGQSQKPLVLVSSNPVSENYFSVLRLRPFLGRLFEPGDKNPKSPVAVMTYSCWRRLGSDRNVVGKTVGSYTIVGVTPREFTGSMFGINGDLLVPLSGNDISSRRDQRSLYVLARLKPGVSRSEAEADLSVLSQQLAAAYPKEEVGRTVLVSRASLLPPDVISTAELAAGVLLAFALFVLMIACANVANLLLAMAVGRQQEAAIKLALGVSRKRLVRDFLLEGAIICALSGVLGYTLAAVTVLRYSHLDIDVPVVGVYSFALKIHLDALVVACTLGLMLVAMLAAGLPAALYASSPNLSQVLGGEITVGGTRKAVRRNAITIAQVAMCTLVLVGMGLCLRSLHNLRTADPGFSARNIVADVMFPTDEGFSEQQGRSLYERVREAVSGIAGIESVALSNDLPLFSTGTGPVRLSSTDKPVAVGTSIVDENYFSTFEIPVIEGRVFRRSEEPSNQDVVVINRGMAEKFWPGQDPVGRGLITGDPPRAAVVIGIVGNVAYEDVGNKARPHMYYALSQHYDSGVSVIARTNGDPRLWTAQIGAAVRQGGFQALSTPITFENIENLSLLPQRVVAGFASVLSGLGLLLAIVGLFGAISYSVSERKKELGIRVALGARPWQLMKMVFRQTLVVSGAGVVAGLLLGVAITVLARSLLYNVGAVEWAVLLPVAVAMVSISIAVAYLSARPWLRVDPMEAVRHS